MGTKGLQHALGRAIAAVAAMLTTHAAPIRAQATTDTIDAHPSSGDTTKTFVTRRDLAYAGVALAATGVTSIFDPRIARWVQQPSVLGGSSRHHVVRTLSDLTGETTLTWATVGAYAIGRLAHASTLADVSLHLIEAQALTSVVGQTIRGVLGRSRPSVDVNQQYDFHWGRGFTNFDFRSFPSLHSAAGFVVAAGLVQEMHERNAGGTRVVAPLLFVAAAIPGVSRMYLNQHWASDVVAGAFLGTLAGSRVVHYAHTHRRTKLDRVLLGNVVVPRTGGGFLIMRSVAW